MPMALSRTRCSVPRAAPSSTTSSASVNRARWLTLSLPRCALRLFQTRCSANVQPQPNQRPSAPETAHSPPARQATPPADTVEDGVGFRDCADGVVDGGRKICEAQRRRQNVKGVADNVRRSGYPQSLVGPSRGALAMVYLGDMAPQIEPRLIRRAAWRLRWVGFGLMALLVVRIGVPGVVNAIRQTCPVVVLADQVDLGQNLESSAVTYANVACELVPVGAIDTAETAIGQRAAANLPKGMVLVPELLAESGILGGTSAGLVVAPVRLSDSAVAALLQVGDRIDVLASAGASAGGEVVPARLLASKAQVVSLPVPGDRFDESGLVLLAVTPTEAELLGGAASWTVISAVFVS